MNFIHECERIQQKVICHISATFAVGDPASAHWRRLRHAGYAQ